MTINISGQVPPKEQNGMYELEAEWEAIPEPPIIVAVVLIERDGLTLKHDKRKVTMKFVAIEPLDGALADQARALLNESSARRGGATSVPTHLDIPDEPPVEADVDLDTPLAEGAPFEPDPETDIPRIGKARK